ncbi:MAG: GNAT family N-acetyltransferase [Clostridiales bacterium]|jgi:ribosomal protein S18 acetylase RimI-like enzyme|nr:GNAT family N-acetyltransferase [Clostridiales bacterium]
MGGLIRIASAEKSDFPALVRIWTASFDDTERDVIRFLNFFYSPGSSLLLFENGKPAAAAHLISGSAVAGLIGPDGLPMRKPEITCAYLYAVGVLPEFRGRGYGAAVSRRAAEHSRETGADICVTVPADSGLYKFYKKNAGFETAFYAKTVDARLCGNTDGYSVLSISPDEYSDRRENLLAGRPHLRYAPRWSEYFTTICGAGGGLFEIKDHSTGEAALAAVESDMDRVILKELLCRGGTKKFLEAAAGFFHKSRVTARLPGGNEPFAMASQALSRSVYWGIAFD